MKDKVKQIDIVEHLLSVEEVIKRYETSININKPAESHGLGEEQIKKGREVYGPNLLSPAKRKHPFVRFLECLGNLFNVLMILAGLMTFIIFAIDPANNFSSSYVGAILVGVSILNAIIEFIQLQKSANALEAFLNMIPQQCRVVRNSSLNQIPGAELVPGDIVFVRLGDKIPADLYMFNVSEMKVDNSSLTGESEPQPRTVDNAMKNPLEAHNIGFNGTLVVAGEGYGIVIKTGDSTVLGQIAGLTANEKKSPSPLSVEVNVYVKLVASVAFLTGFIFFLLGLTKGMALKDCLTFGVGVFCGWVPEGLPATLTMLLTFAAKRMATQNVLVKDLHGVETLGAITLLATDKTGTLTRNQMTVTSVWASNKLYASLRNLNNINNPVQVSSSGMTEILLNCSLNSRAKFDRTDVPIDKREIIGDATEAGLIRFAAQSQDDFDELQIKYPRVFDVPFNSDNKWAMTISQVPHANGDLTLYLKGAPERVLNLCSTIFMSGQAIPLTEEHKAQFQETYENMAGKGHRVLAFAQLLLPGDKFPKDFIFDKKAKNYPTTNLTFVGLTSLEDPPKHGVREAIGMCRTAGIRVMMVTGDHPLTAEAIGRKINLMLSDTKPMVAKRTGRPIESIEEDEYDAIVIHGEQIDGLSNLEWDNIFSKSEIIFARTSPRHKLEIVKRAQSMGHIVGVTGDGVNDSPALKKADLGIAMNESGSDVSKEAASMILLDDNFASTIRGIEEGRLIFANLKKSIRYTVTHTMPEVIPQLLYIAVPIPLLLNALQIISLDLGYELCLALSFAWDKPETKTGLMRLAPRKPVTKESVERFRRVKSREIQAKRDPETGEEIKASGFKRMIHNISRLFTMTYWKELIEKTDNEVIVDVELISWAFFEAGLLEFTGAAVGSFFLLNYRGIGFYDSIKLQNDFAFSDLPDRNTLFSVSSGQQFTRTELLEILAQFETVYTYSVVVIQAFNMFCCKSRITYPFGKHIFTNYRNFVGMVLGFVLMGFLVYCPGVNTVFNLSPNVPLSFLAGPILTGSVLLCYSSLRFFLIQRFRPIKFNPAVQGLMMHPTVRTIIPASKS
ncbi:hypothetical protein K502DRAFT_323467 [Neoconidiobolus thromboides FSU 785]|nr:hypothetical protein K502DRAFT_323467 [Neoconidiobolus thromboides FSU 785]